ncbi:amino acid adenylation domain-containing protein [Mucilaginibacter aquaedulcis]|uniref:amino acid adenylation domain-containing protein n=1 Tax=Mucilaginibacter aquaedulcis TaxID=1187081 RepID=UPI0025B368FC|nr:amino acid adenylation domain-containing protein [Mucilaginibacter aquaedulcis]MDN3546956.1 amino acid adenylation domain-containing protein [Mucilaginibacter aquaedulcis]
MSNPNLTQSTELSEALSFWQSRFALINTHELNTQSDHFQIKEKRAFLNQDIVLSDAFKERLSNITDDPLTTFGIITALFSMVFSRYQSSSLIAFMVPFLKEEDDNNENSGLLPLIIELENDGTFKDFLNRAVQVIENSFSYAAFPFEQLAKADFGVDNTIVSNILISSNLHELPQNDEQFDIKIKIDPELYNITLTYDKGIFPEYRAKLLEGHLNKLGEALEDVSIPVSSIEIITDDEITYLMSLNPERGEASDKTILDLFSETVKAHPDRVALLFEGKSVTYRELDSKSSQLALYLRQEYGACPDSIIALMTEKSELTIIGVLGILKSGAAYVPVDPSYPQDRIEYLLTASGAQTLITTSGFLFNIPFFAGNIFAIDLQLDDLPDTDESFSYLADKKFLAYIIYTSGSTGKPKGVAISHASLFNYLNWAKDYYFTHNAQGGNFALFTSVSFDLTITSIFIPLIKGAKLEIFSSNNAGEVLTKIFDKSSEIDTIKLTPTHVSLLADIPACETALQTLIVGGEALREDHVGIIKTRWPHIKIFNEYGPTEATVGCVVAEVSQNNVTIGQPIANTAIYILDQNRKLLPAGSTGEIYIGGTGLANGYYEQPELTDASFINSPFVEAEKIYKTGDLGAWLEDGTLQYLGRKDSQVKIRGYRIETGEIESTLLEVNGIKDAAVVIRFNNKNASLAAFYTSTDNSLQVEEIESILAQKLPAYMVPSLIVHIDEMPLTPNFKIDRQKLASMETGSNNENGYVAPVSDIETALVNIFSKVLGREKVGITDNFFAIGGDSIIGIQIVSRANSEGIMITLKQLFKQLTIAGLASVAERAVPVIIEQAPVFGYIELTPVHKWFFEQKFPNVSHYNQSLLLEVDKGFNASLFETALAKIITHHDMLRMRLRVNGDAYEEYIPEDVTTIAPFSIKEILDYPDAEIETRLMEDINQLQASLNVFKGPVLQARYYQIKNNPMLFLVAHHLIVDGVSWRILLEDLSTAYMQLSLGKPVSLPNKTSSFKAWAFMASSASSNLAKEIPFWVNGSWMKASPLPVDREEDKNENTIKNSLTYSNHVDEETTRALLSTVHATYNTNINDLLLAALVMALSKYTNSHKLLIAMEGHGREEVFGNVDVSRTVGWFTSIYPVLLELNDTDGASSIIIAVKEQLRSIPNNGVGYGLLKYGNQGDDVSKNLSAQPQPQVIFNYLGQSATALPLNSGWKISTHATGNDQDAEARRKYLIEINALIIDDRLVIDWTYCTQIHHKHTIKKIADDYAAALKELTAHCLNNEEGVHTPSDFPEAGLEQEQLDHLFSQFKF